MKKVIGVFFALVLISCSSDKEGNGTKENDFDRNAILVNWADNIIIPAHQHLSVKMDELQIATIDFTANPSTENLNVLRTSWLETYKAWQHVALFQMTNYGKASQLRFRQQMNTYPTNEIEIQSKITSGTYNLELPSAADEQGLPAMGYLLYGLNGDVLTYYTTNKHAENYKTYLSDLIERMALLTNEVTNSWTSGFRDEFVANNGASSSSAFNMMANAYILHYERFLRSGKIGIPAGVFSGEPLPGNVEGLYANDISKQLFMEALEASRTFFNGKHFGNEIEGASFASALKFMNSIRDGEELNIVINDQYEMARNKASQLDPDFKVQVETDNTLMLETYNELQRVVVYLKIDMAQALSLTFIYQDNDGD